MSSSDFVLSLSVALTGFGSFRLTALQEVVRVKDQMLWYLLEERKKLRAQVSCSVAA